MCSAGVGRAGLGSRPPSWVSFAPALSDGVPNPSPLLWPTTSEAGPSPPEAGPTGRASGLSGSRGPGARALEPRRRRLADGRGRWRRREGLPKDKNRDSLFEYLPQVPDPGRRGAGNGGGGGGDGASAAAPATAAGGGRGDCLPRTRARRSCDAAAEHTLLRPRAAASCGLLRSSAAASPGRAAGARAAPRAARRCKRPPAMSDAATVPPFGAARRRLRDRSPH